jgi:hypothetical protein
MPANLDAWVGFDLDGVLAYVPEGRPYVEDEIGEPIPAMVDRLKEHLRHGDTVKIFTARAYSPVAVKAIKAWLLKQGLPDLNVTNVKDHALELFYDDRSRQVVKNTGRVVGEEPPTAWQTFERMTGVNSASCLLHMVAYTVVCCGHASRVQSHQGIDDVKHRIV